MPSCTRHGCVHGDCVAVDTCACHYSYYGPDCRYMCDCSGHSACSHDGSCAACQNHTAGMKCELCDKGYVRKGRDCVACREICHGNSDTCIDKTGSATGLVTAGRVKCVNCMNNTEGEYCERCKAPLYYHEPLHGQCARCTCNQHSWTCNRDTGLGCTCEDNTISSYIENPTPCSQRNDCHMYQCDECREGYSGDPTNGSLCYQNLRQDTLYSFKGDMSVARPFFVPAVNNEYHWVYIEMVNLSGIIHATTDPKKYDSKVVRLQVMLWSFCTICSIGRIYNIQLHNMLSHP